jgi:hypothetical protein
MGIYITLDEAKEHLRVDFDDDDVYINSLISLVEEVVLTEIQGTKVGEGTVSIAGTTALIGEGSNFLNYSAGDTIIVKNSSLGTIESRTIASITSDTALTVTLAFTATASDLTYVVQTGLSTPLPNALKHAMLLLIGHFYMVREPIVIGVNNARIPYAYQYLIAPYKNWTLV